MKLINHICNIWNIVPKRACLLISSAGKTKSVEGFIIKLFEWMLYCRLQSCKRLHKKCPYSVLFWSTFFPHFPAVGLNTEEYGVFLRIQSECEKMRKRITNAKIIWLHVVVLTKHDILHFWDNSYLLKHYPVKVPQNFFNSSNC